MFYHHGTIRTYVGAILNLFNDLEVQYKNSAGEITSRNIPVRFSSREKSKILDEHTTEQILSGNFNVLPRANLLWSAMVKSEQRTTNKHVKVNTKANENNFEFLYNSVPYEFMFELAIICRGMNEATMIIEQIASKFNPIVNIDVYDAVNLDEPTRIPVSLLDIGISTEDYEEISNNIVTISCGLSIKGNIYPPIKSIERIKDFKMIISTTPDKPVDISTDYSKKIVFSGEVIDNEVTDPETFIVDMIDTHPKIIEIVGDNVQVGSNEILAIWEDIDSTIRELTFEWNILSGDASIDGNKDKAVLNANAAGDIEVLLKITDENGNYTSKTKIFTIL
jgi:hypothetical protein